MHQVQLLVSVILITTVPANAKNSMFSFIANILLQRLSMQRILREPFSDYCQWWAPVELIRRTLFIIFIVIDPGNLVSELYMDSS